MQNPFFILLLLLFIGPVSFAQPLPVIKANTKSVDILDGDNFQKGIWQISPEVKPDIYYASRDRRTKKIAFYTDIDSISFAAEPEKEYKFIILLNGRDTAYTTVSTVSANPLQFKQKNNSGPLDADTIPFTLGKGDKIYIKGKINNGPELNFMFDTGSNQEVISKSGLSKGASLYFNGAKSSATLGGVSTVQNSNKNTLEIGNLVWKDVPFARIDEADADGIIGYNVFDKNVVEIDYDKKLMIVHTQPVKIDGSYERLPLVFKANLPFVEATLLNGTNVAKGYFEFDAGSNGSLWVNKAFAKSNNLYGAMKSLGETSTRGLDGRKIRNEKVILPGFAFGKYSLKNVPIDLELLAENANLSWGILGMDVLKRYNTVLDFQHDSVYLKPNSLTAMRFHKPFGKDLIWMCLTLLVAVACATAMAYKSRKAKKKGKQSSGSQTSYK